MDNEISCEITKLKEVNTEERGQANKILAYTDINLLINGQKIAKYNGLRFQQSRYLNTLNVTTPQVKGTDGIYRNTYEIPENILNIINQSVTKLYESRNGKNQQS